MVEGMSNSLPAFEVTTRSWYNAGSWRQGSEEGSCAFLPFTVGGNTYAWAWYRSEGHYSSKTCRYQASMRLSVLRTADENIVPIAPADESLLITYRARAAFLPATTDRPALSIGGTTHAGMNSSLVTAAVEAITKDGRLLPMPSLNEARSGAVAFRVGDGILVTGGHAGSIYDRRERLRMLPAEWLPSSAATLDQRWVVLNGASAFDGSAIAQLADSSLLIVDGDGRVSQLKISEKNDPPRITRVEWPVLNRARRSNERERIQVRELADGRIVVAGGQVQAEKIALYEPDGDATNEASNKDVYIGIGGYVASRRHEIFDPSTRRWQTSAPSSAAGGRATILDDGRVIKIGHAAEDGASQADLQAEISDAEGKAWAPWPTAKQSKLKLNDHLKLFVVDGELFASGELELINTGGGASGLEWLNSDTGQWALLWEAGKNDNWRDHVGRMVVRHLANAKVAVLPVEGP